jgi:hypothetical protein
VIAFGPSRSRSIAKRGQRAVYRTPVTDRASNWTLDGVGAGDTDTISISQVDPGTGHADTVLYTSIVQLTNLSSRQNAKLTSLQLSREPVRYQVVSHVYHRLVSGHERMSRGRSGIIRCHRSERIGSVSVPVSAPMPDSLCVSG